MGWELCRGTCFGQDLFELVKPERVNSLFFSANSKPWTATAFQIDDSGEGQRFIIFDQPCFTSENLLVEVDGYQVLNAGFILNAAVAQAALTFEMEPYSYWKGTYPNVSRDRAEYVSGLCAEFAGQAGQYEEILFASGVTADDQADLIASNLLLGQYTYTSGGYKLFQKNGVPLGTPLGSMIDRVELDFNPQGFLEVVDLTSERERAHFEPERDLERRTQQNSLFPQQAQLQQQTREYQRFGAGLKGMSRDLMNRFIQFLRGNFDDDMKSVRLDAAGVEIPAGDKLDAGTPLFAAALDTTSGTPVNTLATHPLFFDPTVHTVFCGVVVRDGENAGQPFYVKNSGDTLCRVRGPVKVGDPLGAAPDYASYNSDGAYLIAGGTLGIAQQVIADNSIKLIKVRLVVGSPSAGMNFRGEYDPTFTYTPGDCVAIRAGANAGSFVCIAPNVGTAPQLPDTGNGYWISLSGNSPALGNWL